MSSTELISTARGMVPDLSKAMPVVYFLRLRSGMLYVGASVDLKQRLDDHVSGQACRTTQLDPPFALLRVEVCSTECPSEWGHSVLSLLPFWIEHWTHPSRPVSLGGRFHWHTRTAAQLPKTRPDLIGKAASDKNVQPE